MLPFWHKFNILLKVHVKRGLKLILSVKIYLPTYRPRGLYIVWNEPFLHTICELFILSTHLLMMLGHNDYGTDCSRRNIPSSNCMHWSWNPLFSVSSVILPLCACLLNPLEYFLILRMKIIYGGLHFHTFSRNHIQDCWNHYTLITENSQIVTFMSPAISIKWSLNS